MKLRTIIIGVFIMFFYGTTFTQLTHSTNQTKFSNQNLNKITSKDEDQISRRLKTDKTIYTVNLGALNLTEESEILKYFDIQKDCTFKMIDKEESRLDKESTNFRYQQLYKGIKVQGGGYTVRKNKVTNKIDLFSPRVFHSLNLDVKSKIDLCDIKGEFCKNKIYKSELFISNQYGGEYKLIWEIYYFEKEFKFSHFDALSNVLLRTEHGCAEIFLGAPTQNYGDVILENYNANGESTLENLDQTISVYNFDPTNVSPLGGISYLTEFIPKTESNTVWSNETHINAYQTMFSCQEVVPLYETGLNINFENVHAASNTTDFNARAFPFASLENAYISVGVYPNGSILHSLALHDIVAHELSHVYLLEYLLLSQDRPKALHEGISDIFGTYIESLIQSDLVDWVIGDDNTVISNLLDRDLSMLSVFDSDGIEPSYHERGKAVGHWYYLISTGDSNNNIAGLGLYDAIQLIIESLPHVGTTGGYLELAEASLEIAAITYGPCSAEYDLVYNAWDTVQVPVDRHSCCEDEADIIIEEDTEYLTESYIGGNIIVRSNATLTISTNLDFLENKGIIIEGGGKLILNDATLNKCFGPNPWNGIRVMSNGQLNAANSSIDGASTAIKAEENSHLELSNLNLIGIEEGYGLFMEAGVSLNLNPNMRIFDFQTGIEINSSNNTDFYYFNKSLSINNCSVGIEAFKASVIIDESQFLGVGNGIVLDESHGSMVSNIFMRYHNTGIEAKNSINLTLDGNQIGIGNEAEIGEKAIHLVSCHDSQILNHGILKATRIGIEVWDSNTEIIDNVITVNGMNADDGGIKLTLSSFARIHNNNFDLTNCQYGIQTNNANFTRITNNSIGDNDGSHAVGIIAVGSTRGSIKENIIIGVPNNTSEGISVFNSSFNLFSCNHIMSVNEGLRINTNSEMQSIRGNEFIDCRNDLIIGSRIGLQAYKGNNFINGTVKAIGLSEEDLTQSVFLVNSNYDYHMPSDPQPIEWFRDNNEPNYFDDCSEAGPDWLSSANQVQLCRYFKYLKRKYSSNPDRVFVKLIHLVRLYGSNFPRCILQDPFFNSICGFDEIIKNYNKLNALQTNRIQNPQLKALHLAFIQSDGRNRSIAASRIGQYVNQNSTRFKSDIIRYNAALITLKDEFDFIACNNSIADLWADVLSSSLKYLIEGTIDPGLINHAQRCSDRYGDVIHLSRALVNTQQNIDLDIYDDCDLFENTNQRSASQQGPKDQQIILYPNPVSTQLVVEFGKEFSGNIQIMSMDGKVLRNRNHSKIFKTEIDIALGSGLYLLKTISKDGEIRTNKFLVSN